MCQLAQLLVARQNCGQWRVRCELEDLEHSSHESVPVSLPRLSFKDTMAVAVPAVAVELRFNYNNYCYYYRNKVYLKH